MNIQQFMDRQQFGAGIEHPENTPYIYLTGPWIYLVMVFIIGIIIINCTMCLCITCQKNHVPVMKTKNLYDDDENEQMEVNIYGQ